MMENTQIAEALFRAFEEGDASAVRRLSTEDMQTSQNHGPPMNLDTLLEFSDSVLGVVQGFHYEDANRSATETGFVEEHRVRGTLPDGSDLNLSACVVADVQDGKVSSLREYFDTSAAAGLLQALSKTQ